MKRPLLVLTLLISTLGFGAGNETPVEFLASRLQLRSLPEAQIAQELRLRLDLSSFRAVKVQAIYASNGSADHLILYLFSKRFHRVDFARAVTDRHYHLISIERGYDLKAADHDQQPGIGARDAACPDESVEFLSVAPNNDSFELGIAKQVADAAKGHHLRTVELYRKDATRANWLNYMSCPKLRGNFYDGDANPSSIVTSDGVLSARELASVHFRHEVTNIWLACEAYNDPMLSAVTKSAQSKKYAAGKNDLQVGPSDDAAACAMKAALDGKPMTQAFEDCYKQYDTPADQWGFGGDGADLF